MSPKRMWATASFGLLLLASGIGGMEVRDSVVSARAFSNRARTLTTHMAEGRAPDPVHAPEGPYDQRLAYPMIPAMVDSVTKAGWRVSRQANASPELKEFAARGFFPPYLEKQRAGLSILDESGRTLHRSVYPLWTYGSFDEIPEVVWRTLVWIEDRELSQGESITRNPAIDWDRLTRAFFERGLQAVGRPGNVSGGSTVATQLEKFRHSPGGRTAGLADKWRQVVSASVRAYWQGPSTAEWRQHLISSYLNSVPLAGHPEWGEVLGLGEGLRVWFGVDPEEVNAILRTVEEGAPTTPEQAKAFSQVLSLIVAQRRPGYYLRASGGPERLAQLSTEHARLLARAGVIPAALAKAVDPLTDTVDSRVRIPRNPPPSKVSSTLRSRLLSLLKVASVYDLDRMDLEAVASHDSALQAVASDLVRDLTDPAFVTAAGLRAPSLIGNGDPSSVLYSILLVETRDGFNRVRVEIDNVDGASSLNASARLELGSTAKLRTLVTYLETLGSAFDRLRTLDRDSLSNLTTHPRDPLTSWVRDEMLRNAGVTREALLGRAMNRRYSANPNQSFRTGGGVQTFRNFSASDDAGRPTVREAFSNSINLPFVRILRDVIDHIIFRPWSPSSRVLSAPDSIRRPYVERFLQGEARQYLRRFDQRYQGLDTAAIREEVIGIRTPRAASLALRWIDPDLTQEDLVAALTEQHQRPLPVGFDDLAAEYVRADPGHLGLADIAYLSNVHPLELWVAQYRLGNPNGPRGEMLDIGALQANDVYGWLLGSGRRSRQDPRIYSILEIDAFAEVLVGWQRLGYPFGNIVPSIGTAIGSSGDRPSALAELTGIIVNGGLQYPLARVTQLDFAGGTPYEVSLDRPAATPARVMNVAVADLVRSAMVEVVEDGTGRRARGALLTPDGVPLQMGAKTGTGDNRIRTSSGAVQVRSRTATIAFFAGDRWFGVVTAYVPGEAAAGFRFTSALAASVLRIWGNRSAGLE